MIDLILNNPFVLAISFHSGALVVNYPWNDGRVREIKRANLLRVFALCTLVLWIRIRIRSVFRSVVDPDPYSEYGYENKLVNIGIK